MYGYAGQVFGHNALCHNQRIHVGGAHDQARREPLTAARWTCLARGACELIVGIRRCACADTTSQCGSYGSD